MKLTVTADEVEVGDTILGVHNATPYVIKFVVDRVANYNRDGVRVGPRLFPVNSRELQHLDFRGLTRLDIERGEP